MTMIAVEVEDDAVACEYCDDVLDADGECPTCRAYADDMMAVAAHTLASMGDDADRTTCSGCNNRHDAALCPYRVAH